MPITFQQVTTEFISFGATLVTLPRPSALQIGDGMVVHISHQNVSADVIPPAGWTENLQANETYVASKIADAADVAAVDFKFNFIPAASPVSSRCASLMSFSGVDPSPGGFVDNIALIAQPFFGTSDPIFCPALVASKTARFVLSAHSSSSFNRGQGASIHTGPAGFTERADGSAFEMALGVYTSDVESLSIPSESISITGGFGGNRFQTGVSMAMIASAAIFKSISTVYQNFGVATSVTVPAPAGLCVGELMVVMGITNANFGTSAPVNFPVGWTILDQSNPAIGNPIGFLGTKIATQADLGANFVFSHNGPTADEWNIGIWRIAAHAGLDTFAVTTTDDIPLANPFFPSHITVADNILAIRFAGWENTGTEPTAIGALSHTIRAQNGGPFDPGPSDPTAIWATQDVIESPPGSLISARVISQDGTGNTRAVGYSFGVVPGPLLTDNCQLNPAVAVGVASVGTTFIPIAVPPPPPALVDGCEFAGIDPTGSDPPDVRDGCGIIPRVDDAVEFVGVQAGQAEPVEPVGGFFSLGRVRQRILNPNSVQ